MPLRYIYGQDELVASFVAQIKYALGDEMGDGFDIKRIKTIGIINDSNELIAGLIYYNFNPDTGWIELSLEAIPKQSWLTRTTLAIMFQYPFITCGCQTLATKTSLRHQHVLRMLAALNFKLISIPRLYGRDRDGILCLLSDDDWKAGKICQRFKHHLISTITDRKVA